MDIILIIRIFKCMQEAEEEQKAQEHGQELEAARIKAEMWRKDPLHAKLSLLKDMANVHRCVFSPCTSS